MISQTEPRLFDYRLLRFLVGLIAFFMPLVVLILAHQELASISASYYTGARDAFVGMLFIVGTFLIAYNGKTQIQAIMSKLAAIAAIITAVFPTSKVSCADSVCSRVHYGAAAILFVILIYFCLVFYLSAKKKSDRKKTRRMNIYLFCGIVMLVSVAGMFAASIFMKCSHMDALCITYWGEVVALEAFGVAWLVAGRWKALSFLSDPEDSFTFAKSLQAGGEE